MTGPECIADRYELRDLLGRGGMGEVFDAWDRRLDRPVAVKLLSHSRLAEAEMRQRFEAEALAAAKLIHPKVVGVFDSGEHEGIPFIVMERLPGRTLADEMAAGPLPPERVRRVLLDMLEALGAAHRAGIIHRDVKPSNVLIAEDGSAKIGDFGIAKADGRNLTRTGNFIGTAEYLSPERLNNLPAGPESDLYSVGVVGYEALTGRRPFEADTPLGLVKAISHDPVVPLRDRAPGIDPDLERAITVAMARAPEERFRTAAEMRAALAPGAAPVPGPAAASGLPARGVAPGSPASDPTRAAPLPAARPWFRRLGPPWVWAVVGGLAVLLLLRLGAQVLDTGPHENRSVVGDPDQAAQTDRSSAVAGVTAVEFLGPGRLRIEQTSDEESLTIEAAPAIRQLIRTDVRGHRLVLGIDPAAAPGGANPVEYRLALHSLTELRTVGAGQVEAVGIDAGELVVEVAGSSGITVSGRADHLMFVGSGSGKFEGSRLEAEQVTAQLSGSGDALVAAASRLQGAVSGSGSLEYIGNPDVLTSTTGSGRVSKVS